MIPMDSVRERPFYSQLEIRVHCPDWKVESWACRRRIIVPADVGYGSFPDLEPQPFGVEEKRALDSVVKNPRRDQTVMFDVKVERVR